MLDVMLQNKSAILLAGLETCRGSNFSRLSSLEGVRHNRRGFLVLAPSLGFLLLDGLVRLF
jgi:hypothetical protein